MHEAQRTSKINAKKPPNTTKHKNNRTTSMHIRKLKNVEADRILTNSFYETMINHPISKSDNEIRKL